MVINLPPSHVAGTSEAPMTTFYAGGTGLCFGCSIRARPSMPPRSVPCHHPRMIPTQYRMLWAVPDYDSFDLSSVKAPSTQGRPWMCPSWSG